MTVEDNLNRMCFNESGILFGEFEQIFYDALSSNAHIYEKIVLALANGQMDRKMLVHKLQRESGSDISQYLDNLEQAGFIKRDFTWHISNQAVSKLSCYRLSDNYLRFYLKYIRPNEKAIKANKYKVRSLNNLKGWSSIMGFQFENLVLANRAFIHRMLNVGDDGIEMANPYFQNPTNRLPGCQIDYLIQTKTSTLYACKIKFSQNPIRTNIIEETKQKLSHLRLPKGFSCLPVLIHVNGVTDSVIDSHYFFKIIDFSAALEHA